MTQKHPTVGRLSVFLKYKNKTSLKVLLIFPVVVSFAEVFTSFYCEKHWVFALLGKQCAWLSIRRFSVCFGFQAAGSACPLSYRGETELLQGIHLPLGVAFHEMNFLLGLRGPWAFLGPPLPVEAQVPAFILGRHQSRVVIFQELLHEHTFLVPAVALRGEVQDVRFRCFLDKYMCQRGVNCHILTQTYETSKKFDLWNAWTCELG